MSDEKLGTIGAGRTDRSAMAGDIVPLRTGQVGSARQRTAPRVETSAGGRPEMIIELTGTERGANRRGRVLVQYQARYTVDEETRRVCIQIVDMARNEVVIEIPSEEVMQMARELQRYLDQARNHSIRREAVGG